MPFHAHLLFLFISLYIILPYDANAKTLEQSKQSPSLGFSWGNCGPDTDSIKLISLSIAPDLIRLPGNVILSTSINITKPIPGEIHANVGMQKNIWGIWVNVPCEHGAGSCSYSVCTNNTAVNHPGHSNNYDASKACPSVPPAVYSVSNLVMPITKSIPSIADGEFRMNIDFVSNYAGHLACLHLDVNLN